MVKGYMSHFYTLSVTKGSPVLQHANRLPALPAGPHVVVPPVEVSTQQESVAQPVCNAAQQTLHFVASVLD